MEVGARIRQVASSRDRDEPNKAQEHNLVKLGNEANEDVIIMIYSIHQDLQWINTYKLGLILLVFH